MNERYPLDSYNGSCPPAPEWFKKAIDTPFVQRSTRVEGAEIRYQHWENREKPGLLLVHGNGAHSHWYDFIAPAFLNDFNVAAINHSGMGDSDWRDAYSLEKYSAEQIGVMQDCGMFSHDTKPIIAGHSFGGIITLGTAAWHGDVLKGVVTMDTPVRPPHIDLNRSRASSQFKESIFPDQASGIRRFRLLPSQACENDFILDHIARHSLKETELNGQAGWTWKFDPTLWNKIGWRDKQHWEMLPTIKCKLAFLRGEESSMLTDELRDFMLSRIDAPFVSIKNANHHLFLDNPLETISALSDIFSSWHG